MTKHTATPRVHPWTASAVWGWRLELALGAISFVTLAAFNAISPVLPYLVITATVLALWRLPKWRTHLLETTQRNHEIARLHSVMVHTGIINRRGQHPVVTKCIPLTVGARYLVRIPIGLGPQAIGARSAEIAEDLAPNTRLKRLGNRDSNCLWLT